MAASISPHRLIYLCAPIIQSLLAAWVIYLLVDFVLEHALPSKCFGLTANQRAAREIHTWSKCQHPNVVELIGLTVFRECLAMVSEWEDNGNMPHYLSRNPTVNRCELSKSICAGVLYLHSMDIVHGDLKGANVLIDRNGAPRLTDFGCASFLSTTLHFTQTNTGPSYSVRWTAPEILRGKTGHTKEGDIYALGMTILEAFTTEVPFSSRSEISLYRHIVDRKKTPPRPESIIPERSVLGNVLWAILMSCWSYNPAGRPTAQAVHTLASQMLPLSPELLDVIAEEPEDDNDD
ncbi:kinase domain protein [Rhizoctonia solani]|uniref:Kinase domain protein n=1 Tax=Rhizoctonia solani TaxID=456999 RepID=A0A8H8P2B6_9AGAM|nr:kinase domain protein [Rhizoctonia solani]QRW23085.1 kinase domain protein [Rhizoctonia solani]